MGHGTLADASLDQGVAVGRQFQGPLNANGATSATNVLHHKGLLEALAEFVGQHSGHHITGSAGQKGHNHLDRLAGVIRLRPYQPAARYHK